MPSTAAPPVCIVLVHWNQPARCLASIQAFGRQGLPMRIIVVDNASEPSARKELRAGVEELDHVELVELALNAGFGPAANEGWRRWLADVEAAEWSVVAPHDALPAPDCLSRALAAAAARPRAGLACADVGDPRVPVVDPYFGGITLPPQAAPAPDGWVPAGYPHGTLMLARRACLQDVGLFDERYFAYCEEADLGERARRAGWQVGLVRGAEVRNPHLSGRTAVVDYLMLRNTLLLVHDRFGPYKAGVRFALACWQLAAGLARPASRPPVFHARARLAALRDFARRRYGPPPSDIAMRSTP